MEARLYQCVIITAAPAHSFRRDKRCKQQHYQIKDMMRVI